VDSSDNRDFARTNFRGNNRFENFVEKMFINYKTKETRILVDICSYFFFFLQLKYNLPHNPNHSIDRIVFKSEKEKDCNDFRKFCG